MIDTYRLRPTFALSGISFGISFLRDELPDSRRKSIDFHVACNDYFGTIATVMNLVADSLSREALDRKRSINTLHELRDDFMYLQETHRIERKAE